MENMKLNFVKYSKPAIEKVEENLKKLISLAREVISLSAQDKSFAEVNKKFVAYTTARDNLQEAIMELNDAVVRANYWAYGE